MPIVQLLQPRRAEPSDAQVPLRKTERSDVLATAECFQKYGADKLPIRFGKLWEASPVNILLSQSQTRDKLHRSRSRSYSRPPTNNMKFTTFSFTFATLTTLASAGDFSLRATANRLIGAASSDSSDARVIIHGRIRRRHQETSRSSLRAPSKPTTRHTPLLVTPLLT
jgi:hypothetical protein